jgi:DNA-binding transcriptional MerR regulator
MARKYLRISEVTTICCVSQDFIVALEHENLISSVVRKNEKVYSLDQVDRIRVAHNLIGDLGVNLEGVEVALHMREQIIHMRRQIEELIRHFESRSH